MHPHCKPPVRAAARRKAGPARLAELPPCPPAACRPGDAAEALGGGTRDVDEFQLPLPGLYADLELGAASLRPPREFLEASTLVQLQVLAGWRRDLDRCRDAALQNLAAEMSPHGDTASRAERLTTLRRTCAALHIEVPKDFEMRAAAP